MSERATREATLCVNCGAPVPQNGVCEYCGTEYPRLRLANSIADMLISSTETTKAADIFFDLFDSEGALEIVQTYNYHNKPCHRDADGRLIRPEPYAVTKKILFKRRCREVKKDEDKP